MGHNIANTTYGYLDISKKTELFKEISEHFNGEFTKKHNTGNVLNSFKISIPYNNWNIEFTESDTQPLKFQISFDSVEDYNLVLSIEDVFDKILKKLGMKEIEVGDEIFDKTYLIKSNDQLLTQNILNNNNRNEILKNKINSISYQKLTKEKKSELITVVSRTIDNKEAYFDLIKLHQMLINSLVELNVISN